MSNIGMPELVVIFFIIHLLSGDNKMTELASDNGSCIWEFKKTFTALMKKK